jgi:hypothetical protein
MVLAPVLSADPLTAMVAMPLLPESVSGADPSEVVPAINATFPVGATLPVTGFTVTVNCVVPVGAMLAELAATTVIVAAGGTVTVTVALPVEAPKPALPA